MFWLIKLINFFNKIKAAKLAKEKLGVSCEVIDL